MPEFQSMFTKSKGKPISYNGKTLHLADKLPVHAGDAFCITFEKTNSNYRQGVTFDSDKKSVFQVDGELMEYGFNLWEDTIPKKSIPLSIVKTKGEMWVHNIWDHGDGVTHSCHNGAAMIIEEIENGKRYLCNDGHPDENFDDIVFRIERIQSDTKGT
jgi:hypothetical protein